MKTVAVALAAVLALAACGSSDHSASHSTSTSPPPSAYARVVPASSSPNPSQLRSMISRINQHASTPPLTWTIKEAAARYLANVKAVNASSKRYAALPNPATKREIKAWCKQDLPLLDKWIRFLHDGHWPTAARSDVKALIKAATINRVGEQGCADASTAQEAFDALREYDGKTLVPANLVRVDLGLPATK